MMTDPNIATSQASQLDFLNTDLRGSILAAATAQKSLLCFLTDNSSISQEWESLLRDQSIYPRLSQIVTVRIETDTQESQYLSNVVPSVGAPAIVVFHNGQIEHNYQSSQTSTTQLKAHLHETYGSSEDNSSTNVNTYLTFSPPSGRMRLSNNAYDAMSAQTKKWVDQKIKGDNILRLQLRMLSKISELQAVVEAIRSRAPNTSPVLPEAAENRLLNTPATALTSSSAPVQTVNPTPSPSSQARTTGTSSISPPRESSSDSPDSHRQSSSVGVQSAQPEQQVQRNEYIRSQREREAAEKAEKERIKATIKAQQEERKQQEKLKKEAELAALRARNSTTAQPSSTDIRLQVRAFDGHAMTTSFPRSATIERDVRPWVDQVAKQNVPYNLKIMLAPTRNRDIQAGEEEKALSDLGIVGSATMIMVPVRHYVESYSNRGSGIIPAVTGVAGSVVGTINWLLGWDRPPANSTTQSSSQESQRSTTAPSEQPKVRTLADQRADEASKTSNELYNGNQLNFQGKKPDDSKNE